MSGIVHADNHADVCMTLTNADITKSRESKAEDIDSGKISDIDGVVNGILNTRNPKTGLSPSHWGHPGCENLAFLYDKAVDALILKAAGRQKDSEEILDYFVKRLNIPLPEVIQDADTNYIYGIIKLTKSGDKLSKSIINSIDIDSARHQGKGILEFWSTPGPTSFLIFAMLNVNPDKYKDAAVQLGGVLAALQDDEGSMRDGDRAPDRVHTEPHMDSFDAFSMLYKVTGDEAWKAKADKAYEWFIKNVYHPEKGSIDQGIWSGRPSDIFAEDAYSWTMAGPAGDRMPPDALKKLTENMLKNSLSKITLVLPDGVIVTVILVDFSNSEDARVRDSRGGYHPLGSVEWTGGAALALQKNAVRFWNAGDAASAGQYKAMAEVLLGQTMRCFYYLDELKGKTTFYATGQGYQVAPFGSVRSGFSEGWITPSFLAKAYDGENVIKGGSTVGAWPLLPYLGVNPFILGDGYKKVYDQIPLTVDQRRRAFDILDKMASAHYINEVLCKRAPEPPTQIVEPAVFNREMWRAITHAETFSASGRQHYRDAINWAQKIVSNPVWVKLAKRDNALKEAKYHGIIRYPWGKALKEDTQETQRDISRYPLLNEVGCAMWGLATANFELGDYDKAKYWMERIIADVPLHQIAATEEAFDVPGEHTIVGYWNALVLWEDNPSKDKRAAKMMNIYRQALRDMGLKSAKPKTVGLTV